jgi:hypothetical protein
MLNAGAPPDAFGLAVYDALWVTAQAFLPAGCRGALRPSNDQSPCASSR